MSAPGTIPATWRAKPQTPVNRKDMMCADRVVERPGYGELRADVVAFFSIKETNSASRRASCWSLSPNSCPQILVSKRLARSRLRIAEWSLDAYQRRQGQCAILWISTFVKVAAYVVALASEQLADL
ncbi:hypothetical protein [Bradyrhizobium sacchari]|uniref:hypothetical protein n=1 Tax=Bradyrhizobium sacchari TaxID=1399419 RepID=UPI0010A961EF|nr:hypothetical protein [Bradyrhizobium sacchari]